ncbi:hypothetical protein SEA_EUGENEKRABS_14 [Microbacterium phage EugeneKrabs]|nr:hypothetical protein SEA_EUGENEKRABS_14 [Microbacterium phage EugeneKrabs]
MIKWCEYEWTDTKDDERYRCNQPAGHKPENVHTSENGKLNVEPLD